MSSRRELGYWETIRRTVYLLWQADRRCLLILSILTLVSGFVPVVNIYINSNIFSILAHAVGSDVSTKDAAVQVALHLGLLAVSSGVGQLILMATEMMQPLYQKRAAQYVQRLVAEKAASLDLAAFEDPAILDLIQNASREAAFRPLVLIQSLLQGCSALVTLTSLTLIIVAWHFWLVPVILIGPLLFLKVTQVSISANVETTLRNTEKERRAQYLRSLLASEGAAKEIRVFSLKQPMLERLCRIWAEQYSDELGLTKRRAPARLLGVVVSALDRPVLIAIAATELLARQITFLQFGIYTQSIAFFHASVYSFSNTLLRMHESRLFLASLFAFMELEPVVEAVYPARPSPAPSDRPRLAFRDVCFAYPAGRDVLSGLSFELGAGEVVAIVGRNGAGKSTIVKLLAGLYPPASGSIRLDDHDLKSIDRASLREKLGVVFQDFVTYQFTIAENLALGRSGGAPSEAEMETCSRATGLHAVVERLPAGYRTLIGKSLPNGHELSGGQKQLLAFTRLLLRDVSILVLDEPTAALDVHAEQKTLGAIISAAKSRGAAVLLISHRLASVRHADRILYIEDGRVVEQGSHEELLARSGRYAEMVTLQAKVHGSVADDGRPHHSGS